MSLFDQVSSPYGVGAAPFRPPVQVQPNDSIQAAVSRGGVPANVLISNVQDVGLQPLGGNQTPTLLSEMSEAGANGTSNFGQGASMGAPSSGGAGNPANGGNPGAPSELTVNAPASALTFAGTGLQYGG